MDSLRQKYKDTFRLDTSSDSPFDFVLNLAEKAKDLFSLVKWDEAFTDALHFLLTHRIYFQERDIHVYFGAYHSDTSGCGEFGWELIQQVLDAGVDFIFSIDQRDNPSLQIPMDTISIPAQCPLFPQ